MSSQEPPPEELGLRAHRSRVEHLIGERVYDAFVVRLWRVVGSRRLLRVEVEHAQSGGVAGARGVDLEWIGPQIAVLLGESRSPPEGPATGQDPPCG
jgi:hypothetical protein